MGDKFEKSHLKLASEMPKEEVIMRRNIRMEFIDEIKNLKGFKEYLENNDIEIEKGVKFKDWIVEQIEKEMNRKLETKKEE